MSFLDDAIGVGKAVFGGDSTGATLARTAALAAAVYAMSKSGKSNDAGGGVGATATDPRNRVQLQPSTDNRIPLVYGSAFVPGIITDAQISNENNTMHFVFTICEKTGVLLSDDTQSEFTFEDIFYNDQRIVFKSDGITVNYTLDRDSNVDYSLQDLVRVYCFAGSSSNPVVPEGYTNGALSAAYTVVPNWTINHAMNDLIFAVVEVNYNRDRGITQAPSNVKFHISNTLTQPGDCLYDYMTNTRYGAGLATTEINA